MGEGGEEICEIAEMQCIAGSLDYGCECPTYAVSNFVIAASKSLGGRRFGRLLALHRGDHHAVGGGQFVDVVLVVRLDFLRHKILSDDVLRLGGVRLFGGDPASELVVSIGVVRAREFVDLGNRLGNRRVIFFHFGKACAIVIDAARNFAVSGQISHRQESGA